MKRIVCSLLSTVALLVSVGCSTLNDSTTVESKFPAEAYTAKLEFDGRFLVTGVNGRPEESRKLQKQMKLVPGTHEIEVVAQEYQLEGTGVIPLTVADGQVLELTTERDGAELNVDVWDITDHNRDPLKIATHAMEITASAYTNVGSRSNNPSRHYRPLQ